MVPAKSGEVDSVLDPGGLVVLPRQTPGWTGVIAMQRISRYVGVLTALVVTALASQGASPSAGSTPTDHRARQAIERRAIWANPRISERSGSESLDQFWYMHTANSVKHPRRFMVVWDESDGGMGSLIWNPLKTRAEAGGFAGSDMLYSQWKPGRPADLFNTGVRFNRTVNTGLDERNPTMFKLWLLFTRNDARTDTHQVLLYNSKTRSMRHLATARGALTVTAGQVSGDYATWFISGPRHSSVFLYRISTKQTTRIPRPKRYSRQYRPAVDVAGTVYFIRRAGKSCGKGAELVRYPLGGPAELMYELAPGHDGIRAWKVPGSKQLYYTERTCSAPRTRSDDVFSLYW